MLKKLCSAGPQLLLALCLTMSVTTKLNYDGALSTQNQNVDGPRLPLRLAFMDSTSEIAQAALIRHVRDLDGVIGDWLTANPDGTLTEEEEPTDPGNNIDAALRIARSRTLQILAMVSDENGEQRGFTRLSDPKLRSKFEREIIGAVQNHGFDGVVINFSHPAGLDEVAVRTMLKELRTHLLPTKTVAVFVPGDAALDYKALAAACDLVIVELFNEDPAEPGPLALASWSKNAAALRASDIPIEKLIFAIGVFGKDWSNLGGSQPISFNSVMLSAVTQSATIRFDRKSGNPRLQFVDRDGYNHDIWFLDAVTFLNQIVIFHG